MEFTIAYWITFIASSLFIALALFIAAALFIALQRLSRAERGMNAAAAMLYKLAESMKQELESVIALAERSQASRWPPAKFGADAATTWEEDELKDMLAVEDGKKREAYLNQGPDYRALGALSFLKSTHIALLNKMGWTLDRQPSMLSNPDGEKTWYVLDKNGNIVDRGEELEAVMARIKLLAEA